MDKLTLIYYATVQPKRAVQYGPAGVVRHSACALSSLEGALGVLKQVRVNQLNVLELAPAGSWRWRARHRCFECGGRDLEFE